MDMKEKLLARIRQYDIIEEALAKEEGCDVDEIYVLLRAEIQQKQVIVDKLPSGDKVLRMNPHYLGWKAPASPAPTNPGSPWRAPGKGVNASSTATKPSGGSASKASLGIEFVRNNGGRATSAEMKAAMDLPPKYSPSQFLGPALKKNILKRDGDDWVLGDAEPAIDIPKFVKPEKAKTKRRKVEKASSVSTPPIALKALMEASRSSRPISHRTRFPRRSSSAIFA